MSNKWTKIRNTICSTCLSRDRKLFPAKEVKQLTQFFRDIPLPRREDRICWECKANVAKMIAFRDKVLKAQTLLAEVFSGRQHENILQTLTKLTKTTQDDYNETVLEDAVKYEFYNAVKEESETGSPINNGTINESDEETESETEFKSYRERLEAEDAHLTQTRPNDEVLKSSHEELDNTKQLGADHMETDSDSDFSFNDKKKMEDNEDCTLEWSLYGLLKKTSTSLSVRQQGKYRTSGIPESDQIYRIVDGNTTIDAYRLKNITEEELINLREKKQNNKNFKNSRYKCFPCIETFYSQKRLDEHLNSKHNAKKYKCKICEQTFSITKHLDDHTKTHSRSYVCCVCGSEHFQEVGMWKHYESNHDFITKDCKLCDMRLPTLAEYRKHQRDAHTQLVTCDICSLKCKSKTALEQHIVTHSTNRERSECTICHKQLLGKYGLKRHMRSVHSLPDDKTKEAAYCPECDVQFKDERLYKVHLATTLRHNAKENFKYKCEQCDQRFTSNSILSNHVESVHNDVKKYNCEICKQAFKTGKSLRMHVREKHEGRQKPRNAVCEICAKAFTTKNQLQQHMNSHTGARPYVCSTCGATFSHSGALYTHNRLKHGTKQSLTRKHVDAERNEITLE